MGRPHRPRTPSHAPPAPEVGLGGRPARHCAGPEAPGRVLPPGRDFFVDPAGVQLPAAAASAHPDPATRRRPAPRCAAAARELTRRGPTASFQNPPDVSVTPSVLGRRCPHGEARAATRTRGPAARGGSGCRNCANRPPAPARRADRGASAGRLHGLQGPAPAVAIGGCAGSSRPGWARRLGAGGRARGAGRARAAATARSAGRKRCRRLKNQLRFVVRCVAPEEIDVPEGKMIVAMVAPSGQGNPAGSRRAPRRVRLDDPMTTTVAVAASGSAPQPCRRAAAATITRASRRVGDVRDRGPIGRRGAGCARRPSSASQFSRPCGRIRWSGQGGCCDHNSFTVCAPMSNTWGRGCSRMTGRPPGLSRWRSGETRGR
jgi:hypothetical protein